MRPTIRLTAMPDAAIQSIKEKLIISIGWCMAQKIFFRLFETWGLDLRR